jgi:hypothetical protein
MTTTIPPALRRLIVSKRMPHALILHGQNPQQVTEVAHHMAQTCNGLSTPIPTDIPDDAPIYEPIADILICRSATRIGIDTITFIHQRMRYGPSHHPYGIVILHNAHTMTHTAVNASLKWFEDPPPNVLLFVLAPHKSLLPTTLISRCHSYFIPESPEYRHHRYCATRDALPESPAVPSAHNFLASSLFDQLLLIQSLPAAILPNVLITWCHELESEFLMLPPPTIFFLEKMVGILEHLNYNINVRLQLTAVLFCIQEARK